MIYQKSSIIALLAIFCIAQINADVTIAIPRGKKITNMNIESLDGQAFYKFDSNGITAINNTFEKNNVVLHLIYSQKFLQWRSGFGVLTIKEWISDPSNYFDPMQSYIMTYEGFASIMRNDVPAQENPIKLPNSLTYTLSDNSQQSVFFANTNIIFVPEIKSDSSSITMQGLPVTSLSLNGNAITPAGLNIINTNIKNKKPTTIFILEMSNNFFMRIYPETNQYNPNDLCNNPATCINASNWGAIPTTTTTPVFVNGQQMKTAINLTNYTQQLSFTINP